MASLFKRKDSSVWWAQYYVVDPVTRELKQVRKSTGQKSKKDANAAAVEMERSAQGVVKAGSDQAQHAKAILAKAVVEIERGSFNSISARRYVSELLAIATGEELPAFTVESWFAEWRRRKAREGSRSTIARYQKNLDTFLLWLGDVRKVKPLESVTMADIRAWRDQLHDEGRAGKTVNNYVKDIGAAFRAAIRESLIDFNPCSALEPVATDDSLERKPFSIAEVSVLLGAAKTPEWRGLILIAAFTGLRMVDAARIKWEYLDLENGLVTLMPGKTKRMKRVVKIPLQPDLHAFLLEQEKRREAGQEYVLPKLAHKKAHGRDGLSDTFTRLMAEAGVDRGKSSPKTSTAEAGLKGRLVHERGFHSLRHTFTSWLRIAGVSEEDRMTLTGHSTRESHRIYSHTDEEALRKAIAKLPNLGQHRVVS